MRKVIDIGDSVLCDLCNDDYTENTLSGGFLFGSYACCPRCAPDFLKTIAETGEEHLIKERCPPELSFYAWVMRLRGGDNRVILETLPPDH